MEQKKNLHVRIYGRVQGVFFRESTRRKADEIGVVGWVRNCRDGSVEALISGSSDQVEEMRSWLTHGPAQAQVRDLVVQESEQDPDSKAFEITS